MQEQTKHSPQPGEDWHADDGKRYHVDERHGSQLLVRVYGPRGGLIAHGWMPVATVETLAHKEV